MTDERTLDLLEAKIEELRQLNAMDGMDLSKEISRLEEKLAVLRQDLYSNLTDWERVRIARHPKRPYALDYIASVFSDFYELRGDRIVGDDRALLAGTCPARRPSRRSARPAEGPHDRGEQGAVLRDDAAAGVPQGEAARWSWRSGSLSRSSR